MPHRLRLGQFVRPFLSLELYLKGKTVIKKCLVELIRGVDN